MSLDANLTKNIFCTVNIIKNVSSKARKFISDGKKMGFWLLFFRSSAFLKIVVEKVQNNKTNMLPGVFGPKSYLVIMENPKWVRYVSHLKV